MKAPRVTQALLAFLGMASQTEIRQGGLKGAPPWAYRSGGWRQSQRRKGSYAKAKARQKNPRQTRRFRRAHRG